MNRMALFACMVLSAGWLGCGSASVGPVSTLPVKGKVTYKGTPITSGQIRFEPEGMGREAHGEIQPDGSFELTTYSSGDGAVPGAHRVSIKSVGRTKKLPLKYANPSSSQLELTISADKTEYAINLE